MDKKDTLPNELEEELDFVEDDETQSLEGTTEASFDAAMDAMGDLLGELSKKEEAGKNQGLEGTTEASAPPY